MINIHIYHAYMYINKTASIPVPFKLRLGCLSICTIVCPKPSRPTIDVWYLFLSKGFCWEITLFCESIYITDYWCNMSWSFNTLRPRQKWYHLDIFKGIFLHENVWIPIKISLKFISRGPICNIPALVQIMAGRRPGDKPLSEPMMSSLTTHICVTRPQWVKIW